MVKKVLPPLNSENQVANLPNSGEWKSEDASFLEKLAKGYEIWLNKLNIPVIRIDANSICLETPIVLKESFEKLLSMPHISAQRRISINPALNYESI